MSFVVPALETVTVPVAGSDDTFPVRRIFCVGRNYSDHVKEMGGDPERNPPFFFCKPVDAIVPSGSTVRYPTLTQELHYEIELVVAIGKPAFRIAPERATDYIYGYAVGIDLTRRDIQMAAMRAGLPWDFGKAFDESAPCGPIHTIAETGPIEDARIWLTVNGEVKQDARTSSLIWSVPELLATLSEGIALKPGDLVYTGTPAGVGPVISGDRIAGGVDGLGEVQIMIGDPH